MARTAAQFPHKFNWFFEHGYQPHYYQALFHALEVDGTPGLLARYRSLNAGRKGGKTMSAAWEVLYYALHPQQFHWDTKRRDSDAPLWIQVLCKTQKVGNASWRMFQDTLREAGLKPGRDYHMNKAERTIEFVESGTLIEWKTAVDPQSLRGPGLDILWMDEAAFILDDEAYNVIRPALTIKLGSVLSTTTPDGKNWWYEEFFETTADDKNYGSVEYRSIDNPYFPKDEWESEKRRMHPLMFKREYMASFDAMVGKELPGVWLTKHFYTKDDLPKVPGTDKMDLRIYMGIDPAISLADKADRFAAAIIGIERNNTAVYLLKVVAGRYQFPDQLDLIAELHQKWRPEMIGIEAQAYQAALAQAAIRMQGMPPVVPMLAQGKKSERILAMSPLFKIGKVRVRAQENDFIDEWLNYDSELKNPKDDTLDAVEIALRTAGALMPQAVSVKQIDTDRPMTLEEIVKYDRLPKPGERRETVYDPHMGLDY